MAARLALALLCLATAGAERIVQKQLMSDLTSDLSGDLSGDRSLGLAGAPPDEEVVTQILEYAVSNYGRGASAWNHIAAEISKALSEHSDWELVEALAKAEGRLRGILRLALLSGKPEPVQSMLKLPCAPPLPLIKDVKGFPMAHFKTENSAVNNLRVAQAALSADGFPGERQQWMDNLRRNDYQTVNDILTCARVMCVEGGSSRAQVVGDSWALMFDVLEKAKALGWNLLFEQLWDGCSRCNFRRNYGLLHQAVFWDAPDIVKTLLEDYGASPFQQTKDRNFPEDIQSQDVLGGQGNAKAHQDVLKVIKAAQDKVDDKEKPPTWKARQEQKEMELENERQRAAAAEKERLERQAEMEKAMAQKNKMERLEHKMEMENRKPVQLPKKKDFDVRKEVLDRFEQRELNRKLAAQWEEDYEGEEEEVVVHKETKLNFLLNLAKFYPDEDRTWKYIYTALKLKPELGQVVPAERAFGFIHHAAYWGKTEVVKEMVETYEADIYLLTKETNKFNQRESFYPDEVAARMERTETAAAIVELIQANKMHPSYRSWLREHKRLENERMLSGGLDAKEVAAIHSADQERKQRLANKIKLIQKMNVELSDERFEAVTSMAQNLWVKKGSPSFGSIDCTLKAKSFEGFVLQVLAITKEVLVEEMVRDAKVQEESHGWDSSRMLANPARLAAQVEFALAMDGDVYECTSTDDIDFDEELPE